MRNTRNEVSIAPPVKNSALRLSKVRVTSVRFCGLVVECKFGLAFAGVDPEQGVAAVAIDGIWGTLLLLQREGVDYGQELTDIVSRHNRAEVEQLYAALHIYAAIFHHAGIAAAGGVHSIGIFYYLRFEVWGLRFKV